MKRSLSENGEIRPEALHLVSVSPFRAVVKIDKTRENHSSSYFDNNQRDDESSSSDEEGQ